MLDEQIAPSPAGSKAHPQQHGDQHVVSNLGTSSTDKFLRGPVRRVGQHEVNIAGPRSPAERIAPLNFRANHPLPCDEGASSVNLEADYALHAPLFGHEQDVSVPTARVQQAARSTA